MADSEQPVAPEQPAPVRTVGALLRNARLAQELTVEQVAAELRIEARQLAALEDNRFEQIGVAVFVKGYIRQYGQRFGLDVSELLALYYEQGKVEEIELKPSRTIKLRDERQVSHWIVAALVLLTIVVGFAAWWWNGGSFDTSQFAISTNLVTTRAPAEAAPVAAPPAAAVTPPVALPPPTAQPAEVAPAAVEAAEPAEPGPATEEPDDEAGAAGTAALVPLEFSFAQESWAEVTDARGERLLFGLNAPGRQVTVRGEPPFAVVLGNADFVRLRVDGADYPIPATGRQGNLARFAVDIAEE